jgi:hypothetical protein
LKAGKMKDETVTACAQLVGICAVAFAAILIGGMSAGRGTLAFKLACAVLAGI